jgi:hypothetical protein
MMQAPAERGSKPLRSLGALATVAVIVFALVGIAVWFETRPENEPELHDEAGIVDRWSFARNETGPSRPIDEPLEQAEGSRQPDLGSGLVFVGPTTIEVWWHARPCATGPKITVTGTPADFLIAVDPRDTGGCEDSSVPYRLVLETTAPAKPDGVTATVTT